MTQPFARFLPPVLSPVSWGSLLHATRDGALRNRGAREDLVRVLCDQFHAEQVILTDSGTSALILALRMVAGPGGIVAVPAYACADLISASTHAEVRLRLYDTDPRTLSPDPESVRAALKRGIDALIAVHLYGMPADMDLLAELASEPGVPVIEDAAQGAGGSLRGCILGSMGSLSILSFGRGKGIAGGSGGALLIRDKGLIDGLNAPVSLQPKGTSWAGLGTCVAQKTLGHPLLYRLPASLPFLRLGEMVVRTASAPAEIGIGNARLARDALGRLEAEASQRRRVASILGEIPGLRRSTYGPCSPTEGGVPGYLRFPAVTPGLDPFPPLGILRGYPVTLAEIPEAETCILPGETPGPGARLLAANLLTLPTHHYLNRSDVAGIRAWAEQPRSSRTLEVGEQIP